VAWLVIGAVTVGLLYPVPAVINVVRTYRSARGQQATGLSALRVGATRVWAVWAAVFIALTLIAYPLIILAGSSSNSSNSNSSGTVPAPATVTVPLGTTESFVALSPSGTGQEPATLRMSDLVYPASPASPTVATALARVCAGDKTIDPLSGVVDVSLIDSSGRQHGARAFDTLPAGFYTGHLAPHACLTGSLSFTVPSGTTPHSLTLFGIDLKTINWSAS
jgi:hypothetical protein